MLSLEFAWAEQLLGTAIEKGEQAKRKAAETTKAQRILTAIAVLLRMPRRARLGDARRHPRRARLTPSPSGLRNGHLHSGAPRP